MDHAQESQGSSPITRGIGAWDFEIKTEVTQMAIKKVKGMGKKVPGMTKTVRGQMGKRVKGQMGKRVPGKMGEKVPGMSPTM